MPRYKLGLLLILVFSIILLLYTGAKTGISLEGLQEFIRSLGFYAPIIFILIYTVGPIFFIPITPLSITAGVLFGPFWGTIYTVIGATSGACATFLVSRYLVKDFIDRRSSAKVAVIQDLVQREGWKFIAIARITPIFPFNVQNYVFGVTNVSFKTFFQATIISLIPGSFVYVYLGYAGKSALGGGAEIQVIIAVILLLLFTLLPYIIKKTENVVSLKSGKVSSRSAKQG